MQVLIFAFQLNSVNDSPPPKSRKLHSSYIAVPYHPIQILWSVSQLRPRLILIQVSRFASRLNLGSISTPSSYGDVRLTSIQFPSHLHPSPKIHASPTSRSCLTLTHAPIFASHIHLSDVSSPSRSWKFHLSSIQVQSQTHPGLEMCISIPSRSCTTCITSLLHSDHVHLNTCPDICIPHPSRSRKLHPNSILVPSHHIQVSWCAPQLNPGPISAPPRCRYLCFTSIQVTSNPDPGHEIWISLPKRFPLTCIQVAGFTSQLHPGAISLPFKSENLHLNSIYVLSLPHLHPGHILYQSSPKYLHLTSIQVLSHLHPNSNILISPPPMYCLTSIKVRSFVSHLQPCDISPPAYSLPFKSWYLHHSSIHVLSHTNPRFNISAQTPSRSRLTSIQVPWLAFHTHPSCPSTPSCCISIPARSHLKPIQVSGWASHLHPCPGSPPFSFL